MSSRSARILGLLKKSHKTTEPEEKLQRSNITSNNKQDNQAQTPPLEDIRSMPLSNISNCSLEMQDSLVEHVTDVISINEKGQMVEINQASGIDNEENDFHVMQVPLVEHITNDISSNEKGQMAEINHASDVDNEENDFHVMQVSLVEPATDVTSSNEKEQTAEIDQASSDDNEENDSHVIVNCAGNVLSSRTSKINHTSDKQIFHATADSSIEDTLQRTPERNSEYIDFDNDDDIADPTYENIENEQSTDESDNNLGHNETEEIKRGRKRRPDSKNWQRNIKRRKRHSGLEYVTKTNRLIMQKSVKPPCQDSCKLNCKINISEETRLAIHGEFWTERKSLYMRRQFVGSGVEQIPIERIRERNGARQGKRKYTNKYSFEVHGKKITVCKTFFLNTLSVSQQTVDTAIRKKKAGGIVTPDKRGKHTPINKISDDVRNSVRNHIGKFPAYESHYTREKSKRRYLGNHLNISRMYQLYLEDCKDSRVPNENIAKEWLYAEIFNYEYNYSFKSPDSDTCDLCDQYKLQLQEANSAESRLATQEKYDSHLADATSRYKLKSEDKVRSRQNPSEKVIMIDLQKCLPTPDLHNSQSFYSLKLWTYNLTIHDATLKNSYCMMWDESVGGRGGNETEKWIMNSEFSENVRELTIWSDNCPSQNRNFIMIMCYLWILPIHLKPTISQVNHKFLARGHTHLEADGDHSIIERERKKVPQFKIMTPLIRN